MTRLEHNRNSIFDLQAGDEVRVGYIPYTVIRRTRGGMGFILLLRKSPREVPGRLSFHGGEVALKTVRPDTADKEGLALFKRELTDWAGFLHPNIVGLKEILEGDSDGWIAAMKWCRGSLRDILNK